MTKIALIDDDPSIRSSVSRLIRSFGYECVAYESAESALADPRLLQMGCLVIDIELLGMNGFELRDYLRDMGAPVPHLFVTGQSRQELPEWQARMKNSLCLTKPVEDHLLLLAIQSLTLPLVRIS